ncbi:hypothetical protein ACFLTU_05565 [Bacteroidota bacterium]
MISDFIPRLRIIMFVSAMKYLTNTNRIISVAPEKGGHGNPVHIEGQFVWYYW